MRVSVRVMRGLLRRRSEGHDGGIDKKVESGDVGTSNWS